MATNNKTKKIKLFEKSLEVCIYKRSDHHNSNNVTGDAMFGVVLWDSSGDFTDGWWWASWCLLWWFSPWVWFFMTGDWRFLELLLELLVELVLLFIWKGRRRFLWLSPWAGGFWWVHWRVVWSVSDTCGSFAFSPRWHGDFVFVFKY